MQYIMALDAGTTSNRCLLFDKNGKIAAMAQQEFRQFYPQPGWVEHDANEIYYSQLTVAHEAMKKAGATWQDIAGIGIANQRETAVVWNRETGEPVYNAIVWQCRRTSAYCDTLKEQGYGPMIREKTGLLPDAYFAGTKVRWILNNVPGAREDAQKGLLLFGTIESWLIWKLTGGAMHVTDYSNASRTMLFNIRTLDWDEDILSLLEIPRCMLPKPVENSCYIGETAKGVFGGPIPILGAAGDQQAALFGQTCFTPGEAKNTYGTGCFLLMNTGAQPVFTDSGLITTIAWGLNGQVNYALEGSVFVAGAAIQWLRDELHLINSSTETEECARRVPDTAGCYLVPAFAGLGTPYWDQYARGCLVGLTRGTNRDHIVRAALESLAYQTQDILTTMEEVSNIHLSTLKVDGGASANNFLMQFQADITAKPVQRPACVETTAMGAAYLAGLAAGIWDGQDALKAQIETPQYFLPQMDKQLRETKLEGWKKAVLRSFGWENQA